LGGSFGDYGRAMRAASRGRFIPWKDYAVG
jgi:hypothetical protein